MFTLRNRTMIILVILAAGVVVAAGMPGVRFASAGSDAAPINGTFRIGDEAVDTLDPAVAYNSQRQEYLVVWWNDRAGCDDIYGQRVSKNGALLGSRFSIAAGCPNDRRYPDVAYNTQQDEYLVVWEENGRDIRGQRLSATGVFSGGILDLILGSIVNQINCTRPAVAYASTVDRYLVAFEYGDWKGLKFGIRARSFQNDGTADGSAFDVEPIISNPWAMAPDLAYNRLLNEFLVVWENQFSLSQINIRAQRVKMAGGAGRLGSSFWVSSNPYEDLRPAVTATPRTPDGQYLVAWEYRNTATEGDIWAQRVAGDGTLQGGAITVFSSTQDELRPAVAGSESNQKYLVAWTISSGAPSNTSSIYGVGISTVGNLLGAATVINGLFADDAALAAGPTGDFLIASDDPLMGANHDIWGRLWGNRFYLPMLAK